MIQHGNFINVSKFYNGKSLRIEGRHYYYYYYYHYYFQLECSIYEVLPLKYKRFSLVCATLVCQTPGRQGTETCGFSLVCTNPGKALVILLQIKATLRFSLE